MRPTKNDPGRAIAASLGQVGLKLEELLDRKTVAKLLGVSTATLKTWVCERKGPHFWKPGSGRGSRVWVRGQTRRHLV